MSLDDGWLSGIIDAKGTFSASLVRDDDIQIKFTLEEKDEKHLLEQIRKLLGAGHCKHLSSGIHCYTLVGVRERERLISYLRQYPLRSKNNIAYVKWKKLRYRLLDDLERPQGSKADKRYMRLVRTVNEVEV